MSTLPGKCEPRFTYDVLSSISAKGFFAAVLLYVVGLAVLFHPSCRERGVVGNTLLQCLLDEKKDRNVKELTQSCGMWQSFDLASRAQ